MLKQYAETFVVTLGALPEEDYEMSIDQGDEELRPANLVTLTHQLTNIAEDSAPPTTTKVADALT